MKIKINQLCRCGHAAGYHTINVFTYKDEATLSKIIKGSTGSHEPCTCTQFQLPNLDLIEYLAEKRGLI